MKTLLLKPTIQNIRKAAQVIRQGGLVIYPTETAYGIAADPFNEQAVKRIYEIKRRDVDKGLIVIVSDLTTAKKYCYLTKGEIELVKKYMPGPLNIVARKKSIFPDFVNKDFAFRISSNSIAQKLAEESNGVITSTSANLSGDKPIYKIKEMVRVFRGEVDIILDGGDLPERAVSTIFKKGRIVRQGDIRIS